MTDSNEVPTQSNGTGNGSGNANIVYILYLVAIAVGITSIIGVIMAYVAKDDAPDWLRSHYHNQINIFWKGLLYGLICLVLTVIIIGAFLFFVLLIWYIVRTVKGMQALSRQEAVANPGSWGF